MRPTAVEPVKFTRLTSGFASGRSTNCGAVGGITQHVDDSTIRAGFLEHDSDQLVGRGTKLGTLEHDRVSAGKRHRHCSNGQDHRGIPGSDAQDNTRAPPQALRHTSNCNIDNGK
jgi:hypothetical protein